MSPRRHPLPLQDFPETHVDTRPTVPPPGKRASGLRRKAIPVRPIDPLEEALLARPVWDSRATDPAVHEILYRLSVGDRAGAIAAASVLLDGHGTPCLATSIDVLDELELDLDAAAVLATIDGSTTLSDVFAQCGLPLHSAIAAVCNLVERRLVVLRPRRR